MIPFLIKANHLHELRIVGFRDKRDQAPAVMRTLSSTFPSIRVLHVQQGTEASVLIKACPNMQVFVGDYPCPRPRTVLKAIAAHAGIDVVQLWDADKGWEIDQLEGLCSPISDFSRGY